VSGRGRRRQCQAAAGGGSVRRALSPPVPPVQLRPARVLPPAAPPPRGLGSCGGSGRERVASRRGGRQRWFLPARWRRSLRDVRGASYGMCLEYGAPRAVGAGGRQVPPAEPQALHPLHPGTRSQLCCWGEPIEARVRRAHGLGSMCCQRGAQPEGAAGRWGRGSRSLRREHNTLPIRGPGALTSGPPSSACRLPAQPCWAGLHPTRRLPGAACNQQAAC
jgi:hypothetical protein